MRMICLLSVLSAAEKLVALKCAALTLTAPNETTVPPAKFKEKTNLSPG